MEVSNPKLVNERENGKTCSRCHSFKVFSEFGKTPNGRDGHRTYCKLCHSLKKKEWYEDNKEHVLLKTKEWTLNNINAVRETKKKWAVKNPEYSRNYKRHWRALNVEKSRAYVSARRKRVQQNTPPWASLSEIRCFYENCPEGHHVDHVVPLNGTNVSGLHVLTNLQYLPAKINMSKRNTWEV